MNLGASCLLALLAAACAGISQEIAGSAAHVTAETLAYDDAPGGQGFTSGLLQLGDKVVVLGREPGGWLSIAPPPGAFCWIDASAIDPGGDATPNNASLVTAAETVLRVGRGSARMPGPPGPTLSQGDIVQLLDRPDLKLVQGGTTRRYRAIAPPATMRFYIPGSEVAFDDPANEPARAPAPRRRPSARARPEGSADRPSATIPIDARLTSVGSPWSEADMGPDLSPRLRDLETEHRAVLRRPLMDWQLGLIRSRYQALLRDAQAPAAQSVIRSHLQQVASQEGAANAARQLEQLLSRGAPATGLEEETDDAASEPAARSRLPFDAEGMLQPTSFLSQGQKLFALIGEEGYPDAYLVMPPGLPVDRWLSRQVGVRGNARYDEGLRSRVISVEELEPLGPSP